MDGNKPVSTREFSDALTDGFVRSIQVIHLAMASGVIMFSLVIIVLFFTSEAPSQPADPSTAWLLTVVQLITAPALFTASFFVFNRQLKSVFSDTSRTVAGYVAAIRAAMIVRLALQEAAALFGMTVCIMAVVTGVMRDNPILWINLLATIAMLLFISSYFPTKDRLIDIFESRILTSW